ncbi:XVIPCD domain-containing protein [Rhodanobacter sp. DHB23]|uniref:XVIPCD domain-containing protein n=1 Tax=Rhodanobacter sp. DHB23 TaxID=2775923 RepID=UPI0017819AD6|nr:XVIPCD domain-containing protein [Rhodanobacter sp. DHB23]MBD8873465.1 peptidoglycan-binding protein [Rhodanobacter sp. DHB23]
MATDRETQLLQAAYQAGITSPKELANFMAQVNAESGGLNKLDESFRYTTGVSQIPVKYAHREGDATLEAARVSALKGHPEELARLMYGGRNGNNDTTDGYTYRGRGYIQLTGKDNYEAAGKALHIDLARDPDLAAQPENAARIAVWYWQNRVPDTAHKDVEAATLAINGGYNGLDTRQTQFVKWEKILTSGTMQHLAKGEAPSLPAESATRHAGKHASLGQGVHGDNVRKLQSELAALGYKDSKGRLLGADGNFGSDTRHAVERFQHDHQLIIDGKVGPQTQQAMHSALQQQATAHDLTGPRHPDHALYEQALTGVRTLDAQHGRSINQQDINLAAALAVEAKHQGITRIDQVALGDNGSRVYIAQNPASPMEMAKFGSVDTASALQTPLALSSATAASMPSPASMSPAVVQPSQPSQANALAI